MNDFPAPSSHSTSTDARRAAHDTHPRLLITLLGILSVISPFSIDTYLPAFKSMANELHTSPEVIALTLSSYFIGLAVGQVIYGPLLDRFGRKRPLYVGLSLFILMSIACAFARDINTLITLRFFQALGGCGAQVAGTAMVRDFFPAKESAKVFSLLFLFIGVSPLLAPSVGTLIIAAAGWKAIFVLIALFVAGILVVTYTYLPEGHDPDPSVSLKPWPIAQEFGRIFRNRCFLVYATAGAFSFAGLFTYVAGSPIIFMEGYKLEKVAYSMVFAVLTLGFIGGNQLNVALLRRFSSATLFSWCLLLQNAVAIVFVLGSYLGIWGFAPTLVLFFVFLTFVGLTYPNAAALALSPFSKNVGSAAALLGLLQMGVGALISTGIGMIHSQANLAIIAILAATSLVGLGILAVGKRSADLAVEI